MKTVTCTVGSKTYYVESVVHDEVTLTPDVSKAWHFTEGKQRFLQKL